jgi:hypothetical protein
MVGTWKELNESIASMSEDDVLEALDAEISGKRRWTIVKRLHQRACALRAARERAVFKAVCAGTSDTPRPVPAPTTLSPYQGDPAVIPG